MPREASSHKFVLDEAAARQSLATTASSANRNPPIPALGGVRFATKAGAEVTLPPEEFLRRLLLHVLPPGFTKIRHFGLLAAGNVHNRLERARALLSARAATSSTTARAPRTVAEILLAVLGFDPRVCRHCHAPAIAPVPLLIPAAPRPRDTS